LPHPVRRREPAIHSCGAGPQRPAPWATFGTPRLLLRPAPRPRGTHVLRSAPTAFLLGVTAALDAHHTQLCWMSRGRRRRQVAPSAAAGGGEDGVPSLLAGGRVAWARAKQVAMEIRLGDIQAQVLRHRRLLLRGESSAHSAPCAAKWVRACPHVSEAGPRRGCTSGCPTRRRAGIASSRHT
jgi:hypothetical protein